MRRFLFMNENKRLYLSDRNIVIGGVCGGIAEYLNVDVSIIRILLVCSVIFAGFGVLAYIIAWIIMPRRVHNINSNGQ
jgi:phage shock protein C